MKKVLKWLGIMLAGLVGLILIVILVGYLLSERRIDKTYTLDDESLTLPTDAASLTEGQRLVSIRGCVDCHGADFGGGTFIDDPMIGTFAAANLTSGCLLYTSRCV